MKLKYWIMDDNYSNIVKGDRMSGNNTHDTLSTDNTHHPLNTCCILGPFVIEFVFGWEM